MNNKLLGQYFLKDKNIINKICNLYENNLADLCEIGCGRGALTKYLISKTINFLGIEYDPILVSYCKKVFNINIIHEDILTTTLTYKNIISNLPYYLSKQFVIDIICKHQSENYILMFQKEFAKKICSVNNAIGITFALCSKIKIEFDISPQCFNPAPSVYSSVISISMHQNNISIRQKILNKLLHFESFGNKKIKEFDCRFHEISIETWKSYLNDMIH